MSVVEQLPQMSFEDTIRLWRNVLERRDKGNNRDREKANLILNAIYAEWKRRSEIKKEGGYFPWPTTHAEQGRYDVNTREWLENGILSFFGYHVGETEGVPENMRRMILLEVFHAPSLPPYFPLDYLNEWGDSKSVQRLKKLAETIASLTRNMKRNDARLYAKAIREWEADLDFLHDKLYVDRFHFGWPNVDVL